MPADTIQVRLTEDLLLRVRRLLPYAGQLPEAAIIGRFSETKLCRLALARGLGLLEDQLLPPEARGPLPQAPTKT